jgi:uncharacterized delta-60 repeat protein
MARVPNPTRRLLAALAGAVALVLPPAAYAAPGDLDVAFSSDGKLTTNFTRGFDGSFAVVIQLDGKIVTAGAAEVGRGSFGLARYDTDGSLDLTFGGDGRVTTDFTSKFDAISAVALQADGKIVVAGLAGGRLVYGDDQKFALARYNADGSLDRSFSGDGKVTTNFTSGPEFAHSVAIQGDGKIIAAGRVSGGGGRMALVRYNADGTLDTSFSGDGKVTTDFTARDDRAEKVMVQGDSKIVVAGTTAYYRGSGRFALARYNSNGSLDASFSGDGKVTTNFTGAFDGAFAGAIQMDGKIVAAGEAGGNLGVARYMSDGTLDTTFGGDGTTITSFTSGIDYADEITIDSDGKIVAVGSANYFGRDPKFALARYNGDGTLDSGFSGDGRVTTNFTSGADEGYSVAIQPADGKIVAAGFAAGSGGRFALARYLGS